MARSLADIMGDDANRNVVCSVLDKFQNDVQAQAAKAKRPETEILACVWWTLTRIMAARGASIPAMLAVVVSAANGVIAGGDGSEPAKPTVH